MAPARFLAARLECASEAACAVLVKEFVAPVVAPIPSVVTHYSCLDLAMHVRFFPVAAMYAFHCSCLSLTGAKLTSYAAVLHQVNQVVVYRGLDRTFGKGADFLKCGFHLEVNSFDCTACFAMLVQSHATRYLLKQSMNMLFPATS